MHQSFDCSALRRGRYNSVLSSKSAPLTNLNIHNPSSLSFFPPQIPCKVQGKLDLPLHSSRLHDGVQGREDEAGGF